LSAITTPITSGQVDGNRNLAEDPQKNRHRPRGSDRDRLARGGDAEAHGEHACSRIAIGFDTRITLGV
jgi:hypothetical protein